MDSTSNSGPRFRFRDHNQEMANEDSSESHTSGDSSSVSSDIEAETDLQSMTAKGVTYLCSELVELKRESDEDFQKNIFSNYSTFLGIYEEIQGLGRELTELKSQVIAQKRLVDQFTNRVSLRVLSQESAASMLEENLEVQPTSLSILETHTENVSKILDTLLVELRFDEALAVLEMEGRYFQNLELEGNFPSDDLIGYNSMILEKRALLADKLVHIAKHPRISAPELQKAVRGIYKLGDIHLATQLLLQYYHLRTASGTRDLCSTRKFLDEMGFQQVAKLVFSMVSQARKSSVNLHGEDSYNDPEFLQWAEREVEVLVAYFKKYVKCVSETSEGLSRAVDAVRHAMSYASLLEAQRINLQPFLVNSIRPCMEELLQIHTDHFRRAIGIFTLAESWAIEKVSVSGILSECSSPAMNFFLTSSCRNFITLVQSVSEEISPLAALQMEGPVLRGLMDLFTIYIHILERSLTGDTEITKAEGSSPTNKPESALQEVGILANMSALEHFFSSITKSFSNSIHHLKFEIDNYLSYIQETCVRLKAHFSEQFIHGIFSSNVDKKYVRESYISLESDPKAYDLVPSVYCLELYLELRKLENLNGTNYTDMHWLADLLRELMEGIFIWISTKSEIWAIPKENLAAHKGDFMQLILDVQFLVEIARRRGYLSTDIVNASSLLASRVESTFISAGFDPKRDFADDEWPVVTAVKALQKLQELEEKKSLNTESTSTLLGETNQYGTDSPKDCIQSINPPGFSIDSEREASEIEVDHGGEESCQGNQVETDKL